MRFNIGPYRILRQIGEGGMGVVYEGVHEAISRRVAIKVLRPDHAINLGAVERFFNEARAVNLIEHPSLVQVSDFGREPDGSAYLVMEFLRGESLASRLRRGSLTTQAVVQIAWQIADALVAVHAQEIVHRDLKPDNIMLVPEPIAPGGERVKILDFGIAKLVHVGENKTDSDMLMGTPAYMSPEQCKGAGQVDTKSDVYSLGVILFTMITGRPPFLGEFGELIAHHLFTMPPTILSLVPQCPFSLTHLVELLLSKEKSLRPTMQTVRTELTNALVLCGREASHFQALPAMPQPAFFNSPGGQLSTLGRSVGQTTVRRPRKWQLGVAMVSGIFILATGWRFRSSAMERIGSYHRGDDVAISRSAVPSANRGQLSELARPMQAQPPQPSQELVDAAPQERSVRVPARAAGIPSQRLLNKRPSRPRSASRPTGSKKTPLPVNTPSGTPAVEDFTDVD